MLRWKPLLCLAQSFLMLISLLSPYDSAFKRNTDRKAVMLTAEQNVSFASAPAKAFEVSEKEKQQCRDWFDSHIRSAQDPAYDFTLGLCSFRSHPKDWTITVGEESDCGAVRRNGKTSIITLQHKKSGLVAEVEATIYEDYASCEWTVNIKNTAEKRSPVIRRFYAADCTLNTGKTTLYVSKGSKPDPDDFELVKTDVNRLPMIFNANGGRSASFLPYMNLSGADGGAVLAVGWTGQWYTSFRQTLRGVHLRAKQEFFRAYLEPGESVRSPLVSLTFYQGDNALKGFETFRQMELDCVYPASAKPSRGYIFADEFSTLNCEELIVELQKLDKNTLDLIDYFWMDAGWYEYSGGWYDGVGNWIADKNRFPEGLKPLSDAMAAKGKKFLLWYEPERVRENTVLHKEGMKHSDWIVQIDDNLMWNLASDGACEYLSKYISASLAENGVSIYRQDFNFTPLSYWQKADRDFYGGREGICENHYVTNLYAYLDCLLDSIDGLVIDNCASGGKRLDLEMTRRSLPLWRSDYNCGNEDGTVKPDVLEATQSMTYGLSFWFVYSGTNRYFHSEYASRTAILTNQSVYQPVISEYTKYSDISRYMTENYYPLTYGGPGYNTVLAMQFGSGSEGAAVIYKREKAPDKTYTLRFSGLDPDAEYEITDIDAPDKPLTLSGAKLMSEGIITAINESPKAAVFKYKKI